MAVKFNPFTAQLQLDQVGAGGGGGSAFFAGEVATYSDLPLDGTAALNSRWLVRSNSGTWPFSSYKQAGIYIRTATGGTDRDADYDLTDTSFHDVMSDDAFLIFDNTDPTKAAKFDASAIATGTTRTISVPDKNITLDDAGDSRTPSSHASSHASAGSDPLFDQDLNTADNVAFEGLRVFSAASQTVAKQVLVADDEGTIVGITGNEADARASLGLGDAATADIGTGSTEVAAGDHGHGNLTSDGKLGSTAGLPVVTTTAGAVTTLALGTANQVLRVNSGASGVEFADPAASGVTGAAASASDVLGVSGANITGVDANADRIIFWDDSASALKHLTVGSGLSLTDTTLTATATGTIGGSTSTDNAIVRGDSTSNTVQDSALVIDDATTSTQANVAVVNAHSETNSALVLSPKGTGAFIIGPKPDGTSTGGNARGLKAVDLSYQRNAATQVASGNYSMVLGGDRCTASGTTAIAGGERATASAAYAVALGRTVTASGTAAAVIGGQDHTASGQESIVVGGNLNTASAHIAAAFGGYALADRSGMMAQANGTFGAGTSADGTAQWIHMVLRAKTTTNSAVELLINNSRVTNGRLTCPSGKIISGIINIHGVKSDGTASAHYVRQFQVKNVGGTSSYPYAAVTIGTDYASSTSITFNDPDTNGDALSVSVTGIASETWRWTAHVSAVETTYGS